MTRSVWASVTAIRIFPFPLAGKGLRIAGSGEAGTAHAQGKGVAQTLLGVRPPILRRGPLLGDAERRRGGLSFPRKGERMRDMPTSAALAQTASVAIQAVYASPDMPSPIMPDR